MAFLIWAFLRRCFWIRPSTSALQKLMNRLIMKDSIYSTGDFPEWYNHLQTRRTPAPQHWWVNRAQWARETKCQCKPIQPHTNCSSQPSPKIKQTQDFFKWWPQDTSVYFGMSKTHCLHLGSPKADPLATIRVQEVSSGGTGGKQKVRGGWEGGQ